MATTPHGSWRGSPHFGLRDLLEESRTKRERLAFATGELNRALADLGIDQLRVESLTCESAPGDEVGRWVVTLVAPDGARSVSLTWSGATR
jgi:hypothetical protein